MAFIAESRRKNFWFGTEERFQFMPTPNRGADVSSTGWESGGTLLNGGGFQLNSHGSSRNYIFEWPSTSSRQIAQLMKSYAEGTFGRGLIYFVDPLIYDTNTFASMWADPSIILGQESSTHVYGVAPTSVATPDWRVNDLPVRSALYDLGTTEPNWRGKPEAAFLPIPEGFTLEFGAIYSATGIGGVYYRTQDEDGVLGPIVTMDPLDPDTASLVSESEDSSNVGVWVWVGRDSEEEPIYNEFENPRFITTGSSVEIRRNVATRYRSALAVTSNLTRSVEEVTTDLGDMDAVKGVRTDTASASVIIGEGASFEYGIEVPANTTVGLGLLAWTDQATGNVQIGVSRYKASDETPIGDSTLDVTDASLVPSTGTGTWLSGTYTSGAEDEVIWFGLQSDSGVLDEFLMSTAGIAEIRDSAPTLQEYFDGFLSPDSDLISDWTGTENESEATLSGVSVEGVTGGIQSEQWATDTGTSLRVLTGETATIDLSDETLVIIPEDDGQELILGGDTETTTAGVPVRVYGTGSASLGEGRWYGATVVSGNYSGPPFHGDSGEITIDGSQWTTSWEDAPDESRSIAHQIPVATVTLSAMTARLTKTSNPDPNIGDGPWIGGQGHSGCKFIGKPTYIENTGIGGGQVGFAASFREVGFWLYG